MIIGQRLRNQPAVELGPHGSCLISASISRSGADLHQEHRLAHGVGDVLASITGFRHPRETGEFIDHPPDVVDLSHDGVGALLEDALVSMMTLPNLRRIRSPKAGSASADS